ncbi:MAG: EVE domain-containing protein [Fimbriimonadaceae bacterium]|nr:EVE domain-containing protein [Fimbriimonadaceae bacterium]QYK55461.1 MAG: EVE domain-containing protein [Fimbriimonadaceae bacterium]
MGHWLMKSEPDCYSIDDLIAKGRPDVWEGCRNFTVRRFFKEEMEVGDLAFFYNSSSKVIGIAGEMRIASEAYPDPTQFDPESQYFDATSKPEKPKWYARDVEFIKKYVRIVTLQELRETPGLESMLVLRRGQRLSVMPVTEDEWRIITALPGI